MYLSEPSASLRQGDVIRDFLFCQTKLEKYRDGDPCVVGFRPSVERMNVVIVSQCCDISKRPYFLISPLRPISNYIRQQSYYENLKHHVLRDPVNLFYYESSEHFGEDCYIDFSLVVPIEKARIEECRESKILELTIPIRDVFRKNLAANFARVPEEDKVS